MDGSVGWVFMIQIRTRWDFFLFFVHKPILYFRGFARSRLCCCTDEDGTMYKNFSTLHGTE